jgi:hypothetical protein
MALLVTMGSMMKCSFGMAPSSFIAVPPTTVAGHTPVGTIMDNVPLVNIVPFGACMSIANPTVAAATVAALGVLTPMPCLPVVAAPWVPGSPTVTVGGKPALNNSSWCMCNWGGVVQFVSTACMTVTVP